MDETIINHTTQQPVSTEPADSSVEELPVQDLPIPEPESPSRPFGLLLNKQPLQSNAYFAPSAAILLTPALRTSGFLKQLAAEEFKTLTWLLTFLTPNGDMLPTVPQLAQAMGVSQGKAQARLQKLESLRWQGAPIVQRLSRDSGMDAFVPNPALFTVQEAKDPEEKSGEVYQAAGREAVIAHSRAHYAKPRAEVEAEIAKQMDWEEPPEPTTPEEAIQADVRQRLWLMGLYKEEVGNIMARYPLERIKRQIEWLPYRHAQNPLRFLLAAIEKDFEPPRALRLNPPIEEEVESVKAAI